MNAPATTTPAAGAQPAPAAPKPGTPEYDAAMIAKFEHKDVVADPNADKAAQSSKPTKPEGIPDKFWNAEKGEVDYAAMAKSYVELEKKASAKPAEPKPATPPQVDSAKKALEDALAAVKAKTDAKPEEIAAAQKALDEYKPATPAAPKATATEISAKLGEIMLENEGKMTDEGYKLAEEAGLSRELVDQFVSGQQALAREFTAKTFAQAGGEEQYKAMIAWAKTGLTEVEIQAFDEAVTSGNEGAMKLAVEGLRTKFTTANGQKPNLIAGNRPNGNPLAFRDRSEMTAAMRDPRYKVSEAYRKDVEARIAASDFNFNKV